MEDKSFQLKGKAEHTEEGSSKVERFHMKPNRISQLWWEAQRLTKLADVHNELSSMPQATVPQQSAATWSS